MVLPQCNSPEGCCPRAAGLSKVTEESSSSTALATGRSPFSRRLGFADVRAVLEVVLQNLRGQGGSHTLVLSLFLRFDGAHYFSPTDDFGGPEPGNFRRQYQANLQLYSGMERFLRLEEQSGTADVLGRARAPAVFSKRPIAQRQM